MVNAPSTGGFNVNSLRAHCGYGEELIINWYAVGIWKV